MDKFISSAHPLLITKFPVFCRYIAENRKDICKKYYPQILLSGISSLLLTPFVCAENLICRKAVKNSGVKSPLFVLGHWRCGTTLLFFLLAQDKQFGFIDPLMTFTMNFYHLLGWAFRPTIAEHLHEGRPMDNIKYSMSLPIEEYISFSTMESDSVYPLNFFPQSFVRYNKNAFIDQFSEKKRDHWKRSYDYLLKKITYLNDGKRLLLKSPDNTARVRLLKEMYPDAKFVNIYRDPYTVIRSTMHLYDKMMSHWSLEEIPSEETMEDWIIETFKMMYEAYFKEIQSLPPHSLFEIKFETFEKDPLPILRSMYDELELSGFDEALPSIKAYWESLNGYQKNNFEYSERLIKKVDDKLGFYFDHYGYERR
ncbi:sulfotransferase [bacterium]|nr:sulfotransferase [bacterium]